MRPPVVRTERLTEAAPIQSTGRPKVVIVGGRHGRDRGGEKLAKAPVEITLVDSRNYSLFQPLIYEVAGAIVNIEDVTHAIRGLLRGQTNVRVRLGTAVGVDLERREVVLEDGERLGYDYLILATGLRSDLTRVAGAAEHAFPMKTLDDALRRPQPSAPPPRDRRRAPRARVGRCAGHRDRRRQHNRGGGRGCLQ